MRKEHFRSTIVRKLKNQTHSGEYARRKEMSKHVTAEGDIEWGCLELEIQEKGNRKGTVNAVLSLEN